MYVIVAGGGQVGFHLARMLQGAGHEALILEKDRGRFREISSDVGEGVEMGDASDAGVLKSAGANRADVMVACTGRDADNLIICQMAKHIFMVGRTIARVNDPGNEQLFQDLGVDATINSTRLINAMIEEEVDSDALVQIFQMGGGRLELVQADIAENSPAAGRPLKDVTLPKGVLVTALIRGDEPVQLTSATTLQSGDTLVILMPAGMGELVQRTFAG